MKTNKEELHRSKELSPHFAPRREEAPLLSPTEVETLLVRRDMLPNTSLIHVRRIIMTLTGLSALGAIAFFAFFNPTASHRTDRSYGTDRSHETHESQTTLSQTAPTPDESISRQHAPKPVASKGDERSPWSAGNDQYYADLSREDLAKLGIVISGDSVRAYKLNETDSVEGMTLANFSIKGIKYQGHSIGGIRATALAPHGVHAPRFYPLLMTFSNGNGAAYYLEEGKSKEFGMISENDIEKDLRAWLEKPGTPGYYAIGYQHSYSFSGDNKNERRDSVKIIIGKNLPQPRFFPLMHPPIEGYSDTVSEALLQLTHYCEGTSATKPSIMWPKTLAIKVDTVTQQSLLDQMDREENSSTMQRLHSIMARLNELVPVIVRMKPGTGEPSKQDFIFWYEPSDELFAALPAGQAKAFRTRLAEPPHCFTAPNAVLTTAEITYCLSEPQKVHLTVHDLTGKERISWDQDAVAGDNVAKFGTETLASGMYLVTVREGNGTERTRRIWVENAHPKLPGWQYANMKSDSSHSIESWVSYDDDSTVDDGQTAILDFPHLELNSISLAHIGIQCNDSLGAFYLSHVRSGNVDCIQLLRKWNPQERIYSQKVVQVGGIRQEFLKDSEISGVTPQRFQPLFVTTGKGRKRIFTSDSRIINADDSSSVVTQKFRAIDQKFREIDQLIPILLRADNSSDSVGGKDLIFWYKPTPEFIALLPDSARVIAQSMTGSGGLASVHAPQGAIQKVAAYPNPSKGKFTLQLSLGEPRTLTFTMRNLLGQEMAALSQTESMGNVEQHLDFSKLPEGIYLLDITSDIGERFVQRIVIER